MVDRNDARAAAQLLAYFISVAGMPPPWHRVAPCQQWPNLRVGGGVTKQTRMLVTADPDSMSGKAQKAARYGIPVVHPRAFAQILQQM
jgi:DNA polymerase-3 subunit epsilon